MEKQKSTQMFVIAVLAIAVLTMSVGFATYTATLNISGNANLAAAKWSIVWEKESNNTDYKYSETTGTGYVSVPSTDRSFNDTDFTFEVALDPGEIYEFTVYAKNAGTFNANLTSVTMSSISTYSDYLKYEIYYNNATTPYTTSQSGLSIPLNAGASVPVKVRVEYYLTDSNSGSLPANGVVVPLTASFGYTQA